MTSQTRMRRGVIAILAVGFAISAALFVSARAAPGNPLGYEPEDTKKYVHDLELYGGKANVLAEELRHWIGSLWHGRRLAATVACFTIVAAGIFAFATAPLPPDEDEGNDAARDERPAGDA